MDFLKICYTKKKYPTMQKKAAGTFLIEVPAPFSPTSDRTHESAFCASLVPMPNAFYNAELRATYSKEMSLNSMYALLTVNKQIGRAHV